jgi:hypothetical protein
MHQKKKSKKKKTSGTHRLTPQDEALVTALLQAFRTEDPQLIVRRVTNASVAGALIEALPADDPATLPLLGALRRTFDDKYVQKSVKRAFFRLKQKGFTVLGMEVTDEAPTISKQTETESPVAFLGPIDATGSRAVFVGIPRIPRGFEVGIGVTNDEKGLIDFHSGTYSKKRMKELESHFRHEIGMESMTRASLSHAVTILESAYGISRSQSGRATSAYLSLRPLLLKNAPLMGQPAIYEHMDKADVSTSALTSSQVEKLFGHELLASWIVDPEKISPLVQDILDVEKSPILLSEAQKAERMRELRRKWASDYYSEPQRIILKHRLEEMAHIFYVHEEEDYARLAVTAAQCLDDAAEHLFHANPVLEFLVNRTLNLYVEKTRKMGPSGRMDDDSSSSIIMP